MSNLLKFMMTVIALALLAYLNSGPLPEPRVETKRRLIISPENKLPV